MPSDTPTNRMNSAAAKRNSSAKQATTASTTRFASRMRRPFQPAKAGRTLATRSATVWARVRVIDRDGVELILRTMRSLSWNPRRGSSSGAFAGRRGDAVDDRGGVVVVVGVGTSQFDDDGGLHPRSAARGDRAGARPCHSGAADG